LSQFLVVVTAIIVAIIMTIVLFPSWEDWLE
jgi:hypothetical protein